MHVGIDIDHTITRNPKILAKFAKNVKRQDGTVSIVHGIDDDQATGADYETAKQKLHDAGFDGLFDNIYCAPPPHATTKAAYCAAQGVDLMVDNNKDNCKAVSALGVPAIRWPK